VPAGRKHEKPPGQEGFSCKTKFNKQSKAKGKNWYKKTGVSFQIWHVQPLEFYFPTIKNRFFLLAAGYRPFMNKLINARYPAGNFFMILTA
jgi:hypothetical protein